MGAIKKKTTKIAVNVYLSSQHWRVCEKEAKIRQNRMSRSSLFLSLKMQKQIFSYAQSSSFTIVYVFFPSPQFGNQFWRTCFGSYQAVCCVFVSFYIYLQQTLTLPAYPINLHDCALRLDLLKLDAGNALHVRMTRAFTAGLKNGGPSPLTLRDQPLNDPTRVTEGHIKSRKITLDIIECVHMWRICTR